MREGEVGGGGAVKQGCSSNIKSQLHFSPPI